MAKATKEKKPAKPRQPKYDPKVTFDDMVNISLTGAGAKKKKQKRSKKSHILKCGFYMASPNWYIVAKNILPLAYGF